jgi:peptidoglycan lytic transglycosylase
MPTLLLNRYCFLALSYSILEAARHPSLGEGCAASTDEQQNAVTVAAITADDHAPEAPLLWVMNFRRLIGFSLIRRANKQHLDEPFGNFSWYRNKNNFIAFASLDGSLRFPMLRLAMGVAALLLAVAYAQAQTAKHSFYGLCAYYQGRGGGLTAAHKTLPFGTRVRVTDLKTGRSVIVVINDRGPFNKGRVLDLSAAAAKALGVMERGVVSVSADVL